MPSSPGIDPAASRGEGAAAAVSFILVNWNTRELVSQAVASILRFEGQVGEAHEVIVVDNGSTDGSAEHLRRAFPGITVLAEKENLGFAKANNLGAAAARGEWLVLFNSDAFLTEPVLEPLLRAARGAGGDGVFACRLANADGSTQWSGGAFPTLSDYLGEVFGSTGAATRRRQAEQDAWGPGLKRVDWVTGAFLMVPRRTYLSLGGLEASIFMYGEDVDFCRKAAKAGLACHVTRAASAVHLGGGSIGHLSASALKHTDRGRMAYFRKWHGPLAAEGLRAIFLLRSALRLAAFGAAAALTGNRGLAAKAKVHALGIASLLGWERGDAGNPL